jgi:hypothetical protein
VAESDNSNPGSVAARPDFSPLQGTANGEDIEMQNDNIVNKRGFVQTPHFARAAAPHAAASP